MPKHSASWWRSSTCSGCLVVAFVGIAIPDKILTIPILAAFVVSLAHFAVLYRLRVAIPEEANLRRHVRSDESLQLTVARAVDDGLIKEHLPFAPHGERQPRPQADANSTASGS